MPRRGDVQRREVLPDPKYGEVLVSQLVNNIMTRGKKSIAENIVYGALDIIEKKTKKNPIEVYKEALRNVKPMLETKSRRVGGANYQVPVEVKPVRKLSLAFRWIKDYARSRSERGMKEKLAGELMDAAEKKGGSVKKREDVHKMAESNKAFAHFRF
jgi:small subunit ribosomal protein S7